MPTTYAIPNGRTVFDATTFTANAGTNVISNADKGTTGFKPDLVWTKSRSLSYSAEMYDSVRGVTKVLIPSYTGAETTDANGLLSFNSNGLTLGYNNGSNYSNGATGVVWQWQAGQGSNTTNTTGTITSTVSANVTAGFSIVTYTGNGSTGTIGHGLGVAPSFIIVKDRTQAVSWIVYQTTLGAGKFMELNTTASVYTDTRPWNNTSPTSTVFSVGNYNNTNNSGDAYVAYCWSEIAGFSKFGSYTGNGSTDGPFIYTGFRPKFVMIKRAVSAGTGSWAMYDTSRSTYNVASQELAANESSSEYDRAAANTDILSNGFKIRNTDGWHNANGDTYIYAAFAENPFKYANAR
jgi:hypothetical protein